MNTILLRVLVVVLSGVSPEVLEEKVLPSNWLPYECITVYRVFRQTEYARIIPVDLDGDRINELLIFNGENGSGGEGWTVMQKINGKYRRAANVPASICGKNVSPPKKSQSAPAAE